MIRITKGPDDQWICPTDAFSCFQYTGLIDRPIKIGRKMFHVHPMTVFGRCKMSGKLLRTVRDVRSNRSDSHELAHNPAISFLRPDIKVLCLIMIQLAVIPLA